MLSTLLDRYTIVDMTVEDPPLEKMIARVFEQGKARAGAEPCLTPWLAVRPLRKYLKILRVSLVERLTYRADFFVAMIFRFLPLVTTFLLWEPIYESSGKKTIVGFTHDEMLAYLLLVQISRMFSSMPGLAGGHRPGHPRRQPQEVSAAADRHDRVSARLSRGPQAGVHRHAASFPMGCCSSGFAMSFRRFRTP